MLRTALEDRTLPEPSAKETVMSLAARPSVQWRAVRIALGAMSASFVFFFTLGFGARRLAPLFARPVAWRLLDAGVGLLMWIIAAALIRGT